MAPRPSRSSATLVTRVWPAWLWELWALHLPGINRSMASPQDWLFFQDLWAAADSSRRRGLKRRDVLPGTANSVVVAWVPGEWWTGRQRSVCRWCSRAEESVTRHGGEFSWGQPQQRPEQIPGDTLKLGWPFRNAPNWGKGAFIPQVVGCNVDFLQGGNHLGGDRTFWQYSKSILAVSPVKWRHWSAFRLWGYSQGLLLWHADWTECGRAVVQGPWVSVSS